MFAERGFKKGLALGKVLWIEVRIEIGCLTPSRFLSSQRGAYDRFCVVWVPSLRVASLHVVWFLP